LEGDEASPAPERGAMTTEELKKAFPQADFTGTDDEYIAQVLAFAERRGLLEEFLRKLGYAVFDEFFGMPCVTRFFEDFAPYSLRFVVMVKEKRAMNGGLIYFGPGDTGVGAPQLSVRIGGTGEGWEVHS
jgi:hypothetical protein